jgi:DNA excision repair protein ERCC-2
MAAGREAHTTWQHQREAGDSSFEREVSVSVRVVVRDWECHIRGRMDGLTRDGDTWVVEEVKSTLSDPAWLAQADVASFGDWAEQAGLYAWLLDASGKRPVAARLVVISLVSGEERTLEVPLDLPSLQAEAVARLEALVQAREAWIAWRSRRREATVPFPHDTPRDLQWEMVADVEGGLARGEHVLLSAPTGSGKTAAVLTGVLRHSYETGKRVFIATAKGTQREILERTLAGFADRGLPLRTAIVRAKERVCLNEVVDCRPEACAHAQGHYDRAGPVLEHLVEAGHVPGEMLDDAARQAQVCPFALSMSLADRADVVVGDYNYAFHPQVALRQLFGESWEEWILVVDEAHNLVERARAYGSAELSRGTCLEVADWIEEELGDRGAEAAAWCRAVADAILDARELEDASAHGEWEVSLHPEGWNVLSEVAEGRLLAWLGATASRRLPADPFRDLAREVQRFAGLLREAGEETLVCFERRPGREPTLRLACLDPSRWMQERLDSFSGSVLLSATLRPEAYHRDLLGMAPERVGTVAHGSDWPPENRAVILATRVSTAYKDRQAHRARTGALITDLIQATPGQVAVFYPSFAMLRSLAPLCDVEGREALIQGRSLSEERRAELLKSLVSPGDPKVLHAVLGGLFAEGVDLPGEVLQTVVVVGPALPPVGLERDRMRSWCEEQYGHGFRYAFLVPGMNRVVQAAGRVVRGPKERGAVVLVGRRFGWRGYQELLPEEWEARRSDDPVADLRDFWSSHPRTGGEVLPG